MERGRILILGQSKEHTYEVRNLLDNRKFEIEIALSVALALEYEDAALRATLVRAEALYKILGFLCSSAHRQKIFYLWRPYLPDPKDEMVLELAVAARASHIVTYNLRDFRGAERFGIQVVRPEDYLDLLEN